jgi:hypothetical protein
MATSATTTITSNMMMKRSSILGLFTLTMMYMALMMICLTTPVRAFTASLPLPSSSSSTRCSTTYRSSTTSVKAIAADPSTAFMIAATSSGIPQDSMPAVLAIVVLGVGFYAYNNNGNSNEESSSGGGDNSNNSSASTSSVGGKTKKMARGKYDISIPYDAAAYLSYEFLLKEHNKNKKATIGSKFDTYNKLYKERAIAEVTIKALQKKVHTTTEEIMELVESK